MKKIAVAMLSLGLLAGSCSAALAAEPEVYYNGQPLTLHQPAVIQDGRTLLALRDMAEQMNVDVQWDSATRLATVTYKDKIITLQPDLQRVLINNQEQQIDVGPQILEDRIYLPMRYLFEMLDADVFYRQYDDGKTVVSVNSKDSYINYVTTSGRQTIAVRNVDSNNTDNPVVMTHDGNVLELVADGSKINLYRTTQTLSRQETTTENALFHSQITDVLEENGQYYAVLDQAQSARYVGTGYHPDGTAFIKDIYTPQGVFRFYGSAASLDTLALESNSGFGTKNVKGYLLDISGSDQTIRDTDYAFSADKRYGFLTDGQLLLIGNVPSEGYKVLGCHTISDTMRGGKLFSQNGEFYVIGSDVAANGRQEIFLTSYTAQGLKANSYVPVSHFSDDETYRYLNITDAVQIGDKAYLLLQTNVSRYLACYDLTQHTFTAEKLNRPYEKFVPAKGSWQLYYCDDEHYYFLQVNGPVSG